MAEFDKMVEFIKDAAVGKGFIVACMEGPAGIGKTAATNQAAKELAEEGLATGKVVTIIASQILPNEVSGITMPVHESKAMEIYDHYRLSSLRDGDILFFDELLEADELVLSACLTLIESRQMMSGKQLPDIQIVAATNESIKPNMLKPNIRQRFVWQKFGIDKQGCRDYIKRTYGLDVGNLVENIVDTGNEYNILTPRSLTKMAAWISNAKDVDQARKIAKTINACWDNTLGDELFEAYTQFASSPEIQARKAIGKIVDDLGIDIDMSDMDMSVIEVVKLLQSLPDWKEVERRLSSIELDEPEVRTVNF